MNISKLSPKGLIIKNAASDMSLEKLLSAIGRHSNSRGFVQIFDAKSIINRTHVIGAYANSLLAFQNNTHKTDSMAMEMLLFAAMTDQIGKALNRVGAKSSSDFIIFSNSPTAFSKVKKLVHVKSDFRPSAAHILRTAKAFGIAARKNKDIDALILERIAVSRLNSK